MRTNVRSNRHVAFFPAVLAILLIEISACQGQSTTPGMGDLPREVRASVVSLDVSNPTNRALGTGVLVRDNLIVTSYSLVREATRVQAVFFHGGAIEVAGWVAARKGKDLVILALKKPATGFIPFELREAKCDVGSNVFLHAGIKSVPFLYTSTKIRTVASGDEMVAGWDKPPSDRTGMDPDTTWLTADSFLPDSGAGGAMIGPNGQLWGLHVGTPGHSDKILDAVHAVHIARLLETVVSKPLPLIGLSRHEDPASTDVPADFPDSHTASWSIDRAQPARKWLTGLRRRLQATEAGLLEFHRREEELRGNKPPPKDASSQLPAQPPGTTQKNKPAATNASGQQASVSTSSRLGSRYQNNRVEMILNVYRIEQVSSDLASAKRRVASLWNELFILADPLEIRPVDDARAVLADFSKITDTFGTVPPALLAKSLLHLRLREFDECEQAADEADDENKADAAVVMAIRARCALLKGDEKRAVGLMAQAGRAGKEDFRVYLLHARCDLDQDNHAAAIRDLKSASEHFSDRAEMDLFLGLALATNPRATEHSAREALLHAGRACEATHWEDWRCLVALAAANASTNHFATASRLLDRASKRAAAGSQNDFNNWRASLASRQSMRFPGK